MLDLVGKMFSYGMDLFFNDNSSSSRQVERYREQDYDYYPAQQQSYQYITHYDPDSVEVARLEVERAELENERVQLMKQAHLEVLQKQSDVQQQQANLEQQRIEHIKQAQLDLLKFQQMTQSALEELKQKGLVQLMQCIQTFYDEVSKNVIQRHNFVEHCHTLNQEQVYQLHNRLKREIQHSYQQYMQEQLPEMFKLLEHHPKDSAIYQTLLKHIEQDIAEQLSLRNHQLKELNHNLTQYLETMNQDKSKMLSHLNQLDIMRAEHLSRIEHTIKTEISMKEIQQPSLLEPVIKRLE